MNEKMEEIFELKDKILKTEEEIEKIKEKNSEIKKKISKDDEKFGKFKYKYQKEEAIEQEILNNESFLENENDLKFYKKDIVLMKNRISRLNMEISIQKNKDLVGALRRIADTIHGK